MFVGALVTALNLVRVCSVIDLSILIKTKRIIFWIVQIHYIDNIALTKYLYAARNFDFSNFTPRYKSRKPILNL